MQLLSPIPFTEEWEIGASLAMLSYYVGNLWCPCRIDYQVYQHRAAQCGLLRYHWYFKSFFKNVLFQCTHDVWELACICTICVYRSEDNFMEPVLSFHFSGGSGDWTQVTRFVQQVLYLLSTSPQYVCPFVWPPTHCVVEGDLKCLVFLSPSIRYWDYKWSLCTQTFFFHFCDIISSSTILSTHILYFSFMH